MKPRISISISAITFLAALAIPPRVAGQEQQNNHYLRQESKLIEFDAPGASISPGLGTQALANNDFGAVVGFYTDTNVVSHGFLRLTSGKIISLDAPGAGLQPGTGQGTTAYSINDLGEIAGAFQDDKNVFHAFLRSSSGSFAIFDAPGAGTGLMPPQDCFLVCGQGTWAFNVNLRGDAAGIYIDANNFAHGFVRSRDGKITTFDAPDASPQSLGTFVCEETCLSPQGAVTGFYFDSNDTVHGYVREPDGSVTEFDWPDAGTGAFQGGGGASINPQGAITGYVTTSNNDHHGYIRSPGGEFTAIDDPSASSAHGTVAFSINLLGAVTGFYVDVNRVWHGFERSSCGSFTNFDAPDGGKGPRQGTRPSTNNLEGEVTGWYIDANSVNHGFVWIP